MVRGDLCFLPVWELARRIRSRALSPVQVMEAHLARIEDHNPALNAFITVCAEEALAGARAAEEEIAGGRYRGPLHGIPFGAKDAMDRQGRILLPPSLREHGRLNRHVTLLGMVSKIEIWDQKRWKEKEIQVSKNSEKISEAVAQFGL